MTNEALCLAIKQGEIQYINDLWSGIYKLIYRRANSFYNKCSAACIRSGVTVDDLVQEGYFAMLYAIKAYDKNKEYMFTTYLNYPLQTRFVSLIGYRTSRTQNEPLNRSASLDKPIGEAEDDGTLSDIVEDKNAIEPFNRVEDNEYLERLKEDITVVLDRLTEQERDTIIKRYFDNMSYKQICDCTSINSLSYVREILNKALRKMRNPATGRELKKYHDDIISHSYHHIGVSSFHSSWTSSTEHAALYLDERYRNL